MGSQSDWATMKCAADALDKLGVAYDARIVSAHRTPDRLVAFAKGAADEGFKVIIAGAGGAAHLPGMVASMTHLPVLGVPVQSKALSGQDSLLSIVQMPAGIPVGTLAIGEAGATNAGLLAAAILATQRSGAGRAAQGLPRRADRGRGRAALSREPTHDPARRNHRHPRRRPAGPDAGHGRGAAGLSLPHLCARSRQHRRRSQRRSSPAPPGTMPRRMAALRRRLRGGHLRVRERAGRPARGAGASAAAARTRARWKPRRTGWREKRFVEELGGRPAPFAPVDHASRPGRRDRPDRRARHPQDPARRL